MERLWREVSFYRHFNIVLILIAGPLTFPSSHYIGPLDSPHYDDGNSKWTNDMPHDGWLDISKPFIEAYKDGATSADSYVTTDELVYWYRPTMKSLDCDATDTTMVAANNDSGNYFEGRPNGYESLADSVFVVAMLTEAGTITIQSGSNIQEFNAPQGISAYQVDMNLGTQEFFLARNGETVFAAQSLKDITAVCPCGIYNFNAYVGTVPESAPDQLQPDGLNSLTAGLHVTTCSATPTLGTVAINPTSTPPITIGSSQASSTTSGASSTTSKTSSTTSTTTSSTTSPAVTTSTSTTISSLSTVTSSQTSSATPTPTGTCNAGTGPGNYLGLCDFACYYGTYFFHPNTSHLMRFPGPRENIFVVTNTKTSMIWHSNRRLVRHIFNQFAGYCPPGPCTCTSYGQPNTPPPETGTQGYPLDGEDDSYLGLCSFDCNHVSISFCVLV